MADFYDIGQDSLVVSIEENKVDGYLFEDNLEVDFLDRIGASDFVEDGLQVDLCEEVLFVELGTTGDNYYLTDVSGDGNSEVTFTVSGTDNVTKDFSHTHTESEISDLDHYSSSNFDSDFSDKSTDDLSEGLDNLYFTSDRSVVAINNDEDHGKNASHDFGFF